MTPTAADADKTQDKGVLLCIRGLTRARRSGKMWMSQHDGFWFNYPSRLTTAYLYGAEGPLTLLSLSSCCDRPALGTTVSGPSARVI